MIRKIDLTTEYEIELDDEGALEYLINAIIGEVDAKLKKREESPEGGFSVVYHNCMCELYYVAGQLHNMGSGVDVKTLINEFGTQWDKVAEKFGDAKTETYNLTVPAETLESDKMETDTPPVHTDRGNESKDRIEQILCDRRLQRGTDCEHWILDGKKESGEQIDGIGSLVILYNASGRFVTQGIISKEYSLAYTEENLRHFLETTLGRFGIDLASGGTLQFMCRDYYIDVAF